MKKTLRFLAVLLALMAALVFASCNNDSSSDDDTPAEVVPTTCMLTLDWATYGMPLTEDYGIYEDSALTIKILGTSHSMQIAPGTTLSELKVYQFDGEDVVGVPISGFTFVDLNDNVFASDTPITADTTLFVKNGVGCVAEGCKITMADGSKKNVEDIVLGDAVLTWDFYSGSLASKRIISIDKTESTTRPVITITTDGGSVINIVDVQGFFDMDKMEYFNISNMNYKHHIGKNIMVCKDGATVKSEKISSIVLHDETLELYDLITEDSFNFISDDALTVVPLLFTRNPYKIDASYKYDAEEMAADRAKYGLAKYEDFAKYASEEAFEKLRLEEVQVLLGKGLITEDYLTYCINKFLKSTKGIR